MLEIACCELTSAEMALNSMADRIVFCANNARGGTTPDFYEFLHLKRNFTTPVFVLIRPNGGPFYYSSQEFIEMKSSIISFAEAGADGFVFGILTAHNEIDEEKNRELLELAGDIPCTFHRAFDVTSDLNQSAETLIKLGFKGILSTGGQRSAWEGREPLKDLIAAYSDKIDIIVAGGVRSENAAEIKDFTQATNFHSSAILKYDTFATAPEIKKLKKLVT